MGSKNALIVLDDADLDNAVECAVGGAYGGTGQKCTASSRLIVTEGIHDRFVAAVIERMKKLVVGHPLKEGVHIGAVGDARQMEQNLPNQKNSGSHWVDLAIPCRHVSVTSHQLGWRPVLSRKRFSDIADFY